MSNTALISFKKKDKNKAKTHLADVIEPNESDTQGFIGDTFCGLEYTESPIVGDIRMVDCKRCISIFNRISKKVYEKI